MLFELKNKFRIRFNLSLRRLDKTSQYNIKNLSFLLICFLILLVLAFFVSSSEKNETNNSQINMNLHSLQNLSEELKEAGVVGFSVSGSSIRPSLSYSNLCSFWEIIPLDYGNKSYFCYGSERCCDFLEMIQSAEQWAQNVYLYKGLYNTTENNTISTRLVYVDYDLNLSNPYSEIYYSDKESINFSLFDKKNFTINVEPKDHLGEKIGADIEFYDRSGNLEQRVSVRREPKLEVMHMRSMRSQQREGKINITDGKYRVLVKPSDHPIKNIDINDFVVDSNESGFINIDEIQNYSEYNLTNVVKVYAIDPTEMNFTNATVTVTATGTSLYKCKDWNFSEQECFGNWSLFKTGLTPGQNYTFTLTPEDPGFSGYTESEGENSTTSTTFINKTVLVFEPENAGNHVVIATAQLHGNSQSQSVLARVLIDGTVVSNVIWEPKDSNIANDYQAYGTHVIENLNLSNHTIELQWASESGATVFIKNARISVIELNQVQNTTTVGPVSLTTTATDIANLSFTPPITDNYLIIASGELNPQNCGADRSGFMEVRLNGVTLDSANFECKDGSDFKPIFLHNVSNLSSSQVQNLSVFVRRTGANGGNIRNVRLSAIRLTPDFDVHLAVSDAESTTTSTTFVNKTILTFAPPEQADYLFIATAQFNSGAQNRQAKVNLEIDGSEICEVIHERRNNPDPDQLTFACQKNLTLNTSSHTAIIKFAASNSDTTASIRNARITAIRITPDDTPPNVTDLAPVAGTSFEIEDIIEIGANVTDLFGVDIVTANVTFPNGTVQTLPLSNTVGDRYNNSFTIPVLLGRYNVTFFANDSSNNINDSETTFFYGNDTISPFINISQNATDVEFGIESVFIDFNASDLLLDDVIANVTYPNGSLLQELTDQDENFTFTSTNLTVIGRYNITVFANDTSGNINTTTSFFNVNDTITINLDDYYGLNSSNGRVDEFNTSNLEPIEYLVLNFSLDSNNAIDTWYFNFTANGTNGCSMGNKQSNTCFSYPDFIQFINGTETATYDGGQGNQGDRIIVTQTGSGGVINVSLKIDEHYNPNVFKWYDALYNFSDVKWQDGTDQRLNINNLIRVEINQSLVPMDADQYKLDFRVNHTNSDFELEAYACNSSYTTGHPHDFSGCTLIVARSVEELQDVGTKFRGIFTKNLIDNIGDLKYILLESLEPNLSKYYAIKTYKARASNYTPHWEYSIDGGVTWNNSGNGYETELNINWFYDGADPTAIVFQLWANSTAGGTRYFQGNVTWDIDPTNNYPPIIHLYAPSPSQIIQLPFNITFSISDPNDDNVNASLFLYQGGVLNNTLVTDMNQSNNSYYWIGPQDEGTYNLTLEGCELGTSDLFCDNDTYEISLDFSAPLINISINDSAVEYIIDSVLIDFNVSDLSLDIVVANVSYPNGTILQELIDQSIDFIFNSSNLTLIGRYNISVFANDSFGNSTLSQSEFFIVNDTISPFINISVNDTDVEFGFDSIFIDFNASDLLLDFVIANVTFPNGTLLQELTDQNENFTFIPTNLTVLGRYNITVFANDTNSNTNTTTSFFNVNDTINPDVNISQNATDLEFGFDSIFIDFNASDLLLDDVIANVTYPNGTLLQELTNQSIDFIFDENNLTVLGRYNITVFANDTSNNINISTSFFNVNDTFNPDVNISQNATDLEFGFESVLIDFNASDLLLDSVIANVTFPNGTLLQELTDQDENFTFTSSNLTVLGRYNITVFANDTSNNINITTSFFNVNDTISPFINISVNNTDVEFGIESVEIDFNASDPFLDEVIANVTYPNGTLLQELTDQDENFTFTSSNLTVLGRYNITVFANDTNANTNTTTSFFNVNDTINPDVNISVNDTDVEFGIESVFIDFNASDLLLDSVIANVTFPNGTLLQELTDQNENFTFIPTNLTVLGRYNITVFANDTNSNTNTTTSFFNVNDTINPGVNISQNATDLEFGFDSIFIDFNASDLLLDDVIANVTYPNGTLLQELTNQSIDFIFDENNLTVLGRYNITVFANDTSNNINISTSFFNVNDTINPLINISQNATDLEFGFDSIFIDFNASDLLLDSVIANVTYPNGSLLQELTNQSVDFIFDEDNLTVLGRYNITVFANDTSNNINITTSFFNVNDTINPDVNISQNATDLEFGFDSIFIDFNASDLLLDSVIANVTFPNGTLLQELTDQDENFTFTPTNLTVLGRYNITVFANDTSENTNVTTSFFNVNDTTSPFINISQNSTDLEFGFDSIFIDFNASDSLLDDVIANVTYPNGSLLQELTNQSIDFIFDGNNLTVLGRYNITVFANDTSGNTNTSTSFFNVNDTTSPFINISVNDTDVEYGIESVFIDFNASDFLLDSVIANVTYPNGTLLQGLTDQDENFTFIPTNLTALGRYNITVFANDTSNNINISTSFFNVNDTTVPDINISINDTNLLFGNDSVQIDFNASDFFLDFVVANVTYPNGSLLQELTNQSIDFVFTPTNLTVLGRYNITVFANDSNDNNNTETAFFKVLVGPEINISVNDTDVEFGIESVEIDFNSSDPNLDVVIANVTYPNGTLLQQLTNQSIDFIFDENNLTVLGRYNITVFANDTSNRINTETDFFNVNDTINPEVNISVNDSDIEFGFDSIRIDFNASDLLLDSVIANVTYPNGSLLQESTNQSINFIFTSTNLTTIGRYNITVFANDTSGNTNTTLSFFNVNDAINPDANISQNATDLEFGLDSIIIDFNASDLLLDSTIANVTYPNGSLLQELTNQSIDFIFTSANLTALGRYNITVFANDTSNNINTTTSFFNVNDSVSPFINISVNNSDVEFGIESVQIDFNASDFFLDSIIANVTYPNGTLLQELTNQSIDFIFDGNNLTVLGRYNITVFANDTSNNINITTSFFNVNDTTIPEINISVNDTDVEFGIESVQIDFNASDLLLDQVIANVTYPNGSLLQQLTNQSIDFIFTSINLTALGRYNITIFANDTSANTNTTTSFFNVNDTISPFINLSQNATDLEFGQGSIEIDFNASDPFLDDVIANVTYPNGSLLQQLTNQSVDFIFDENNLTVLGRYNITVFANDTTSNINTSTSFFNVNDTTSPFINISVNNTDVEFGIESVEIDFNASDPFLDMVIANVTYPNGTLLQQLTNQSIDFIFDENNLTALGRYNITVFANDTSANINTSTSFFNVNDTTVPDINISINDTSPLFGNDSVRIDFNASDPFLDVVIANVTYPNGTLLQELTNQSIDFIFTPANLTVIGRYNITVFANDTNENNNTETSFFNVLVGPEINISVNDSEVEFGIESVEIDFNSSDPNLDVVIANVTYPNGTLLQQLTNQSIDFIFDENNLTVLGRYNITVFANDTSNSINTQTDFFNVNDTINPDVNISINDTVLDFGIESVQIDFNASDLLLDSVIANVTYPNGSLLQQLTNQSLDFIFTPTNLTAPGTYKITVSANDTSNNINITLSSFFVNETTPPTINISVNATDLEFGIDSVQIDFNASDQFLDQVIANVSYPNGSLLQQLTNQSIDFIFTQNNLTVLGRYNITVFANDTSNNINLSTFFFNVNDTTNPNVNISVNDTAVEFGFDSIEIDFNASDIFLDSTIANVTFPNGTLLQQLTNQSIDFILTSSNLTVIGRYNITVFANDTSNNSNLSTSFFIVNDTQPPVKTILINDSEVEFGKETVQINITAADPSIDFFNISILAPNGSVILNVDNQNISIELGPENLTALGLYNITVFANDTFGQSNVENESFSVNDTTPPIKTILLSDTSLVINVESVDINITITDELLEFSNISILYPNGSSLINVSNQNLSITLSPINLTVLGRYNITVFANDTSANFNIENESFNVVSGVAPEPPPGTGGGGGSAIRYRRPYKNITNETTPIEEIKLPVIPEVVIPKKPVEKEGPIPVVPEEITPPSKPDLGTRVSSLFKQMARREIFVPLGFTSLMAFLLYSALSMYVINVKRYEEQLQIESRSKRKTKSILDKLKHIQEIKSAEEDLINTFDLPIPTNVPKPTLEEIEEYIGDGWTILGQKSVTRLFASDTLDLADMPQTPFEKQISKIKDLEKSEEDLIESFDSSTEKSPKDDLEEYLKQGWIVLGHKEPPSTDHKLTHSVTIQTPFDKQIDRINNLEETEEDIIHSFDSPVSQEQKQILEDNLKEEWKTLGSKSLKASLPNSKPIISSQVSFEKQINPKKPPNPSTTLDKQIARLQELEREEKNMAEKMSNK